MVGPNGFEPSTSSVSRKRSRPTELRAYNYCSGSILAGCGESGNVDWEASQTRDLCVAAFLSKSYATQRAARPDPIRSLALSQGKPLTA
jgi:hypothetical protein